MKPPETAPPNQVDPSPAPSPHDRLQQSLLQIWTTGEATILARVEAIRRAQTLLESGSLDEQARTLAEDSAHKLAGILGTFGLPDGTMLARRIEAAMEQIDKPESASGLGLLVDQLSEMIQQKYAGFLP